MLSVAPGKILLNPAAPVVVCRLIRAVYGRLTRAGSDIPRTSGRERIPLPIGPPQSAIRAAGIFSP